MDSNRLRYGDDNFSIRARKLIGNRQTFSFEVAGEALGQLLPFITNGRIADPAKLGLRPKLQSLLAILMLADAQRQAVSFEIDQQRIIVRVGVGAA